MKRWKPPGENIINIYKKIELRNHFNHVSKILFIISFWLKLSFIYFLLSELFKKDFL